MEVIIITLIIWVASVIFSRNLIAKEIKQFNKSNNGIQMVYTFVEMVICLIPIINILYVLVGFADNHGWFEKIPKWFFGGYN